MNAYSYGKVSSKRIIDEVPMLARAMHSRQLRNDIEKATRSVSDKKLEELLEENDGVQRKRTRAREQFGAMEKAQKFFEELGLGGEEKREIDKCTANIT